MSLSGAVSISTWRSTFLVCVVVIAVTILTSSGCALLLVSEPAPVRTVNLCVVADSGFARNTAWQANAQTLIDAASRHFMSWFDIALAIDTMMIWDMAGSGCADTMFEWDCLTREVQRGKSDAVVLFTRASSRHDFCLAGYGLLEAGCVRVAQADWHHVRGGFEYALLTLIHELGHLFGAFHVFHDDVRKEHYVMNPVLSRKLLSRRGVETELTIPEWHPANRTIVQALARRPFHNDEWRPEHWPAIEQAYRTVRREFIGFVIDEHGRMAGHEHNALFQVDYYKYLSSWAALCGMDSCALLYIDSLATVLRAVDATCRVCGTNCQAHLCRHSRHWRSRSTEWLDNRLAHYHRDKAHILLGLDEDDAEAQYQTFLDLLPTLSAADKRKYRAAFELRRERIRARRSDGPANTEQGVAQ